MEKGLMEQSIQNMIKVIGKEVDRNLPAQLLDIVDFHAKTGVVSALAGAIPAVGELAALTASIGNIWVMYARINKFVGIEFSDNVLKTLASGVVSNLAGAFVGRLVIAAALAMVPGIGTAGAIAIVALATYQVTKLSALIYFKIMTEIFESERKNYTAEELKRMAEKVSSDIDIDEANESFEREYDKKKSAGEFEKR